MKILLFLLTLLCLEKALHAQYVYTIKADSVKITNSCDTAELIIENHTQNVPGFLFNKGRGRTEFRRGMLGLNDSVYLIGTDTLDFDKILSGRYFKQGGNRFGTSALLGTKDNYPLTFIQNGGEKGRISNYGHWLFNTTEDKGYMTQFKGSVWVADTIYQQRNVNINTVGSEWGDNRVNIGHDNFVWGNAVVGLGQNLVVVGDGGVRAFGVGYHESIRNGIGILGSADNGIAIGNESYAGEKSIALGFEARTTALNQFVCGGPQYFGQGFSKAITDVYFGSGIQNTNQQRNIEGPGVSYTINGSGAYGSDYAGGNITIAGGKGTGAGMPGNIIFSTAVIRASDTLLQILSEKARIVGSTGNFLINTTTDNGNKLNVNGTAYISDTLTATTMGSNDNSNRVATTAFVKNAIGAPALSVTTAGAADITVAAGTLTRLPDLSGAGSHSVILPSASSYTGQRIYLWNMNSSSNSWTFASSITLPNGTTTNSIANQSTIELISDGSVWIKWN